VVFQSEIRPLDKNPDLKPEITRNGPVLGTGPFQIITVDKQ
jgi:hypothetical protein